MAGFLLAICHYFFECYKVEYRLILSDRHYNKPPIRAAVGAVTGDERQQVTPRLDFDLLHLTGLDDLNVNHRVGERFPQIGNRYGIAHPQAVYVTEIICAIPASMSGNDAVGTHCLLYTSDAADE